MCPQTLEAGCLFWLLKLQRGVITRKAEPLWEAAGGLEHFLLFIESSVGSGSGQGWKCFAAELVSYYKLLKQ